MFGQVKLWDALAPLADALGKLAGAVETASAELQSRCSLPVPTTTVEPPALPAPAAVQAPALPPPAASAVMNGHGDGSGNGAEPAQPARPRKPRSRSRKAAG
jgi:hypothetical protein